ncbi:MAG TPA: PPA1309 family protein [Nocardioides sp.]|nr:PPA1309 family protein [Nocardioides sp.]
MSEQPDPVLGALRTAVREIEGYAAEAGWDQPARLFALVPTADLLAREPGLAQALGVDSGAPEDALTPVEQEPLPEDRSLEDVLAEIMWPAEVFGCAAVVERLVLPPSADDEVPDDADAAQAYAEQHPDREEVRIVAAAVRGGTTYCALRLRSRDDALDVLESPDLVPALLELLSGTLQQ